MTTPISVAAAWLVLALTACGTKATQDTRGVASPPATPVETPAEGATRAPAAAAPSALAEPSFSATPARPACTQNFGAFDANADERVSLQEFLARPHVQPDPESIFASRDADADGSLTPAEFCSGWGAGGGARMGTGPGAGMGPGRGPRMGPGMGMGPGKGPGMGMGPGKGPGMGMASGGGPRCEGHFTRFDTNADGSVTEPEFVALPHPHADAHDVFVARDQNHDGRLTKTEFCSPWTPPPSPSP